MPKKLKLYIWKEYGVWLFQLGQPGRNPLWDLLPGEHQHTLRLAGSHGEALARGLAVLDLALEIGAR